MTREEAVALALAGASAATAGALDLVEFARNDCNLTITEVVENLADAAKLAIEASGRTDEEAMQLLAALSKYLEGWAGGV